MLENVGAVGRTPGKTGRRWTAGEEKVGEGHISVVVSDQPQGRPTDLRKEKHNLLETVHLERGGTPPATLRACAAGNFASG